MAANGTMFSTTGDFVSTSSPVIISASRSTDIPAFYAKWFFHRLDKGYCLWVNPFNQRKMRVCFDKCCVIVFWTKNPDPIIDYLPDLERRGIHYYFQFTLNNYELEGLEPGVPPLKSRIETFCHLSDLVGSERVIWRYDPLIITKSTPPSELLRRIETIGSALRGKTNKLVFSFLDIYNKTRRNLGNLTEIFPSAKEVNEAAPNRGQLLRLAEGIATLRDKWNAQGWPIVASTCAEQESLSYLGIEHNHCIDGELMSRLWGNDYNLMYYLRTGTSYDDAKAKQTQDTLFGVPEIKPSLPVQQNIKDRGQRKECGCIKSKDIGMYNTCPHLCAYCYANFSQESVQKNWNKHSDYFEGINS